MSLPNYFRSDQWVKTVQGLAVSGAHIYFIQQPVTSIPGSEQLSTPLPLATLYTDSTGATQLPQPVVTDSFGHADAYMLPNLYTVAIYNNGTLMQVYADQSVGAAGIVPSNLYTAGVGISIVGSVISGAYQAGSGITIVNGVISATGTTITSGPGISISGSTISTNLVPTGFAGAQAGTTSVNTTGWLLQSFAGSGLNFSINNATNTLPEYLHSQVSSGLAGGNGNYHTSTSNLISLGDVSRIRAKVRLNQTTNVRMWIGIVTEVTALTSDNINANVAAFRYSTSAGDTTWQCYTATSNAAFTVNAASSNFLDATTFHIFELQYTGTSVLFLIDNTLVGTIATTLPTNGNLSFTIGIDNITTAYQPSFDFAWVVAEKLI